MNLVKSKFNKGEINTEDGLRIDYPDFWLHVRPSNTEPVMRIIIEGRDENLIGSVYSEIKEQL
ncbi:MAG: phosphoglucosamine mutase, partial [Candidatus Aminicenantes bacterium]|nr:phosphoglucosamine mutase [Candidatus Aminicenantes bacterium]